MPYNPLFSLQTAPTEENFFPFGDITAGFEFSLLENKTVNKIGLYYPSAGFSTSHNVYLWNVNNTTTPILTLTVNSGTYTPVDYFYWVTVPDTLLLANNAYRVAASYPAVIPGDLLSGSIDDIIATYPVNDLNLLEGGTTFNDGYSITQLDSYPTTPSGVSGYLSYFGPNVGFLSATPYSGPTGQLWPLGVPDPLPVKSDPLMVWTNTPPSPSKLPFSATVGFEFQLGATRRVEELGIYATPVGFTSEHKLTLWNSSQTPLATATVSSGVHTTTDYFHWVPIDGPPGSYVTLPPGTYRVGAFYDVDNTGFSNDAFIEQVSISSIGVNPTVSANYIIGYSGPGDTYPSFAGDPSFRSFFGPNVRFKSTPTGQLWPIGSIFPEE